MPRKFFRTISPPRHDILRQPWLRPARAWLDHPDLWALRRRTVAPAVSLGLFWAWMPLPGHSLISAACAIGLRVHMPLAFVMTFATNPLTMLPMYYIAYTLGRIMLGVPAPADMAMTLDWFQAALPAIWPPLLVGCTVFGLASAVVGFVAVDFIWRHRVWRYVRMRRRRTLARTG